ncbi:MT-A70-domain-containing protein [Aspergillus unguis]
MATSSSILFENTDSSIFLIDIPTSIALAQELSLTPNPEASSDTTTTLTTSGSIKEHKRRSLLSDAPLQTPYPTSCEPKSETARARVLATIPQSEQEIHEAIQPLLTNALAVIRAEYSRGSNLEWCSPRHLLEDIINNRSVSEQHNPEGGPRTWVSNYLLGKRKRSWAREGLLNDPNSRLKTQGSREFEDQLHHDIFEHALSCQHEQGHQHEHSQPPLILSQGINRFENEVSLCNTVVKNTSLEAATIELRALFTGKGFDIDTSKDQDRDAAQAVFNIPPLSKFILCNLPLSAWNKRQRYTNPIPGLSPDRKFNLIVLDPPWANKSVRRSGYYQTQTYLDNEMLTAYIRSVLTVHSYLPIQEGNGNLFPENKANLSIAAIWTTNSAKSRNTAYSSLTEAGFSICEEWIWLKTTANGEAVTSLDGLWRKPYEILVIGRRHQIFGGKGIPETPGDGSILRRIIAAVPDVHSRKPNLKEVFERVFFKSDAGADVKYSALEVFARNLTAGWWACGNEVLKFNSEDWWVDD